jgi:hypothetical protein
MMPRIIRRLCFREKLTEADALEAVFADFDRQLKQRGYLVPPASTLAGSRVGAVRSSMMRKRSQSGGLARTECRAQAAQHRA